MVEFRSTIDLPWTLLVPIRIGQVRPALGTAPRMVTVGTDAAPLLRVDVYPSGDSECFAFEEARVWSKGVAIGFGHCFHFVDLESKRVTSFDLGSYFGRTYPSGEFLLVASAERLFRIGPDGRLEWRSEQLGIDGVIVDRVSGALIEGQGEWAPPGGWRPFRLMAAFGTPVPP